MGCDPLSPLPSSPSPSLSYSLPAFCRTARYQAEHFLKNLGYKREKIGLETEDAEEAEELIRPLTLQARTTSMIRKHSTLAMPVHDETTADTDYRPNADHQQNGAVLVPGYIRPNGAEAPDFAERTFTQEVDSSGGPVDRVGWSSWYVAIHECEQERRCNRLQRS